MRGQDILRVQEIKVSGSGVWSSRFGVQGLCLGFGVESDPLKAARAGLGFRFPLPPLLPFSLSLPPESLVLVER